MQNGGNSWWENLHKRWKNVLIINFQWGRFIKSTTGVKLTFKLFTFRRPPFFTRYRICFKGSVRIASVPGHLIRQTWEAIKEENNNNCKKLTQQRWEGEYALEINMVTIKHKKNQTYSPENAKQIARNNNNNDIKIFAKSVVIFLLTSFYFRFCIYIRFRL